MAWTNKEIAALVELDRAHRKAYTDEDLFEFEMERIFERAYGKLTRKPSQKSGRLLSRTNRPPTNDDEFRDHNGEVHVLYNRCPHRGAQLCSARSGNAGKRIRCSYHAWMFGLDGKLESIPAIDGYDGTNLTIDGEWIFRFPAARAASYRGFWFASLAEDGISLEEQLGEAKTGFDQPIDRAPGRETEVVGECFHMVQHSNWKIFLENQLDASHPGVTHESTGIAAQMVERDMRADGRSPLLII